MPSGKSKRTICLLLLLAAGVIAGRAIWFSPTRILVINARDGQQADIIRSNDCRGIRLSFKGETELADLSGYDAILMTRRGQYLDEPQIAELKRVRDKGTYVFINDPGGFEMGINSATERETFDLLTDYFANPCRDNYRNGLRCLRRLSTPHRLLWRSYDPPLLLPDNLWYHREYGRYFETHEALTGYLKGRGLYVEGGPEIAYIAGKNFPVEGNRPHVDTLISLLTEAGYNIYPMVASGKKREEMLRSLHPAAVIYTPMGRLGNDSFIEWLNQQNIPVFSPFPLVQTRASWLDPKEPVRGGVLTARVVIPEIDGSLAPYCIATQNEGEGGFYYFDAEMERIYGFVEYFTRYMGLRTKPEGEKRIAVCYFRSPGRDALIASGMEVIPSLYNFLKRLREEGYNVDGLPADAESFGRLIHREGRVLGSYAKGAQEEFLREATPVWIPRSRYAEWALRSLTEERCREVERHYGAPPGNLLARDDSIAVACIELGNILLFPQPRPALGDDDFKLAHGVEIAPPHSYIAPYLYMKYGFNADALIHFGTHGNLEFTPGKNAALSRNDWSAALIGNLPHFYFYTTGNVGEAIIARRRTHAALVSHITPPYVESGMKQRYAALTEDIHRALESGGEERQLGLRIKGEVIKLGLHRDLGLDSLSGNPCSVAEMEILENFIEELSNEKITGAYYTMGVPYSRRDLVTTTLATAAEPLAYEMARRDRDAGKITSAQFQEGGYVSRHYLGEARRRISALLQRPDADTAAVAPELRPALLAFRALSAAPENEFSAMVRALSGGAIAPGPGGDPVLNPNVLPTGRNMFSINAESTPSPRAWEDGARLAEATLEEYLRRHGEYPRKVSYTFWAGEFIATEGATVAQVFRMLGVEPQQDKQGHVVDFRLIPEEELNRPRIDVVVQVSGQLRDIAPSRLTLITDAVRLASQAPSRLFPNFVAEGTRAQEKRLLEAGLSPVRARDFSLMRLFGPLNSGYSTGMLSAVEKSGEWETQDELARQYLNNMGASYGTDADWAGYEQGLFAAALSGTDAVVQPRQSNTWGPLSLDHVYEFAGGVSMAVKYLGGKEPEAFLADYRNRNNRRMQPLKEAIAVESRATVLNPTFIKERMKGGEGSAQMFGEIFRNIFGWNATRPSALDEKLYDNLYSTYILDDGGLGIHEFLEKSNPAAFQSMTAVLLESARKGFWKADEGQLSTTASLHAALVREHGAACTEFVCANPKLDRFVASKLGESDRDPFLGAMGAVRDAAFSDAAPVVLKEDGHRDEGAGPELPLALAAAIFIIGLTALLLILRRKRR